MAVSSVSNVDVGALQAASVDKLVSKLSASYATLSTQATTTFQNLSAQADTYSTKLSTLGQIQSGFATIQSKADILRTSTTLSTSLGARTALQDVLDSLNAQSTLVSSLTQPASDGQDAGTLATETGLSGIANNVGKAVSVNSMFGQISLSKLGVSQNSDGTFALDTAAFDKAYQADSTKASNALALVGASVSSEASNQISNGSAYYKSQVKNQGLYDNVIKQQDALQARLDSLQSRIDSLQNGGVTAAAVQDYSAITSVASSAANRIVSLQTQWDTANTQITNANTKLGDLSSVSDSLSTIASRAQGLQDSGTQSSVVTAGLALQDFASALNAHSSLLDSLTAAATGSTAAGSLNNENSLTTALRSVLKAATPSTLFSQTWLPSIGLTQGSDGQFSFDIGTFSTAFNNNNASVLGILNQLGNAVQNSANTQLQGGAALDTVTNKTNALITAQQSNQTKIEAQIAAVENDPFSAAPASSYQKVLTA